MNGEFDEAVPEESVQLDQLQPDETLIDRGVSDVLDEGYVPPDHWSSGEGFGNTASEQAQGETLDMRMAQEVPDVSNAELDDDWNPLHENRQVGDKRAGRLVDPNHGYPGPDTEPESLAEDVGIDGGAASAEEAAVHIIPDDDEDDDDRI